MKKVLDFPAEEPNGMEVYLAANRPAKTKRNGVASVTPDKERSDSVTYLPSLQPGEKLGKLNDIRNETSRGRENLILLQARLKALRKQRQRNNKQAQWAKEKIEFITTVRNRCDEDDKRKREQRRKKEMQCAYLKKKADELKEEHKKQREWTLTTLNTRKAEDGKNIRTMSKQNELERQLNRQKEEEMNRSRAEYIKQVEKQIEEELKKFEENRRQRARSNHLRKVGEAMRDKTKTYKELTKLNNDEEVLLDQLKMSQTTKLTEFRNLHHLLSSTPQNPESSNASQHRSNGSTRRNKSVYTGMFRKVIEEIDRKDLTGHEISLY